MQLITAPFKLIGGLLGLGHKAAPPIQPVGTVTRDDAAEAVASADALARRQGSAADILTGTRGAEALSGSTGKLVLGN